MKNDISVIIATKDRPKKLRSCLKSLLVSTNTPLEIIVIDQSKSRLTQMVIESMHSKIIKHHRVSFTSKSKSLNIGINLARGSLLAFTDDDCIVDKNWIRSIKNCYAKHKDISLCFGQTKAFKPENNIGKICPSTFKKTPNIFGVTSAPGEHWINVGFGNNMTIKSNVIKQLRFFNELLGPGTIGKAAEDAELILRALLLNHKIGYEPKSIIFHDKWLSIKDYERLNFFYHRGAIACYRAYDMLGYSFAKRITKNLISNEFKNLVLNLFFQLLGKKKYSWTKISNQIINQLIGSFVAFLLFLSIKKMKIFK